EVEADHHLLARGIAETVSGAASPDAPDFGKSADRAAARVDGRRDRRSAANRTRSRAGCVLPHGVRPLALTDRRIRPSVGTRSYRTVHRIGWRSRPTIAWRSRVRSDIRSRSIMSRLLRTKTASRSQRMFAISASGCIVLWLGALGLASGQAAPPSRPNIVLMFPDNLGWGEVNVYGGACGAGTARPRGLAR